MTRPPAPRRRRSDRRRGTGRTIHPQETWTRRFPPTPSRIASVEAGIGAADLDLVGFYEKPLVKFSRLVETYVACAPRGLQSYLMAMPLWLSDKLWMADDIRNQLGRATRGEIFFGDHHESHAASAFYPSPFEEAAIVTIDGVGEWATSSIGVGRGRDLREARCASCVFRTRSVSCIPRSRTSPASA